MARHKQHKRYGRQRKSSIGPIGIIDIFPRGYAFCDTDEGSYFIPGSALGGAMPGDKVELRVSSKEVPNGGKQNARVIRVVSRATEYLIGTLEINDPIAVVVAQDPRVRHDLFITDGNIGDAKDGDVVLAQITSYPNRHQPMQGYVIEALGSADKLGMDVDILIHNLDLPTKFSPEALDQAEATKINIEEALAQSGRLDLRMRDIFTIDPVDAKDFDDAISLDEIDGYIRLGVHIADVSNYVAWDDHIDICARDRATSVYLVDRVLPMLPEKLSNDICSLKPGEDRLTMTCDMYLDKAMNVVRYEIYPSVICSKRRFNYDEVLEIISNQQEDTYAQKLKRFNQVAKKLLSNRLQRGAIDFDTVEAKPVLDEEGMVTHINLRRKTDATSMIEEAMILANETVARHAHNNHIPCVYRVHESPSAASLEALLPPLRELGYDVAGLITGDPAAFQDVLNEARGTSEEPLVNYLMLRAMERAFYSTEPIAHFGLASTFYCHFTSPIRRYPDLMVHRLLKDSHAMETHLQWLAKHSSKMERLAETAERDSVELKLCEYLAQHIGEEFIGTISTVIVRGFFVRLENTMEGFVRLDDVHDEYHIYDAKTQTLVGEETGRTYRIGQQVRVRIEEVEPRERKVSFSIAKSS